MWVKSSGKPYSHLLRLHDICGPISVPRYSVAGSGGLLPARVSLSHAFHSPV